MKIKPINKKLIDVFVDLNTTPTGWEPSCWLRLQYINNKWTQIAGIKLPSWKFKLILSEL